MNIDSADSRKINEGVRQALSSGSSAVLVTLIEIPRSASVEFRIGSKLLVVDSGKAKGTLGSSILDEAVAQRVREFASSRDEARTIRVEEFAPTIVELRGAALLFERIESEPRLVIAGAGHVGASLARLAALVGYRVTLIDDRPEFVKGELFSSEREQTIELIAAEEWTQSLRQAIDNGRGVS